MKQYLVLLIIFVSMMMACQSPSDKTSPITTRNEVFSPDKAVAQNGEGIPTFELRVAFPDVPKTITTYEIINPTITSDSVKNCGEGFGFRGETGLFDGGIGMYDAATGTSLLVFPNSGAIEFSYADPTKLYPPGIPALPSNDDAIKIASDFLLRRGLLADDITVQDVLPGGAFDGVTKHLAVVYLRTIDNIPTTGPGAKYEVRIGDQGEVVYCLIAHQNVQALRSNVVIKTPAVAYAVLQEGNGAITMPVNCAKVVIEKVALAYYLGPITQQQTILEPVFVFRGNCLDVNGAMIGAFSACVGAL